MSSRTRVAWACGLQLWVMCAPGTILAARSDAQATHESFRPAEHVISRRAPHMSTMVTISVAAPPSPAVDQSIDAAFAEVARVERLVSSWQETSELAKVHREGGRQPVKVGRDLFDVLQAAHDVSVRSNGAFDPTVGVLWGAWDFRWQHPKIPNASDLQARLKHLGYQKVLLDKKERTVALKDPETRLTLGGIAKGYATDRASAVLVRRGFPHHIVEAGGDLLARGKKYGAPWVVGIRHPTGKGLYGKMPATDKAVATSGNYERYFVKDGVRYHHILDPRTGRPARGVSSATVLAPRAMLADAYATTFFVLGPSKAIALAEKIEGVDALIFDETFNVFMSSGFKQEEIPPAQR